MEIIKCVLQNAILYIINIAKHVLNYKIVKIGPHFLYFYLKGGGGGGHAERRW